MKPRHIMLGIGHNHPILDADIDDYYGNVPQVLSLTIHFGALWYDSSKL